MTQSISLNLSNEAATLAFGTELARATDALILFLHSDLGMGKTTLARGLLHSLGHTGAVKSPTYTLVEPYDFGNRQVYHFDLYRLGDPEELEYMGIRDYFSEHALCLVEWSERGKGFLPRPDLELYLEPEGEGRKLSLFALSECGQASLDKIREAIKL